MCCGKCIFWVNDNNEHPDEYTHDNAVESKQGFCIREPLFTSFISSDKYCSDFVAAGENK